ncbi:fg-gap repeat domain-containing protein [Apiospora marii]|uniref:Fg-gap repeat domain-containing protein n=1 Tax=Apiospora marii TaxID=335849 RepID=A0ABR1S0E0_9PEZI
MHFLDRFCLVAVLCTLATWFSHVGAAPFSVELFEEELARYNVSDGLARRQGRTPPLRILPLGASIVWGQGSSDQNGDQLRYRGWEVNMVGSKRNGRMTDNNVEANPGDVISQVHDKSRNSYGYKPNVVLINAGTNDANANNGGGLDLDRAGARMESLINDLWGAPGMRDTLIVLSTVLPTTAPGRDARVVINNQYKALITRLRNSGRPIVLADMDYVTTGDLVDGVHPNDFGFVKMANVWWIAIERASNQGLIPLPASLECSTGEGFVPGVYAGGLTQRGSGVGDGIYQHESQEKGIILTVQSGFDRDQWFFASLNGNGKDDLVGWFDRPDGSVAYGVWQNRGNYNDASFVKIEDMNVADNCPASGVYFVDLNADGYDDFVCIAPDGNAFATINNRDGTRDRPPTFRPIDLLKQNVGFGGDRVRMGDIDGDGRSDYLVMDDGGNILAWRNAGTGDTPRYWEELGLRFPAKGMGDGRGVRFHDLNGDGRDDWLWVGNVGETTTWTNARSCAKGRLGDGLNVAWRQGFYRGANSGTTHGGMGGFVTPTETYLRDRVHFARILGEPQDFGLRPRRDYVFMQHTALSGGQHRFDMRVWKNIGSGSTKLEADGNKYCNMKGYRDGRMDYVWTLSKGEMTLYPNLGRSQIVGDESLWGPSEVIWDPTRLIGRPLDRRDLHLTDWDGDGACDIVWTDPDNNNRVQVWLNRYPATGAWNWQHDANPAPALECAQRRGLGIHDLAVRFADLTGNGRGDYLCLEKDGRATGFVHQDGGGWENVGQIKFAEPELRDRADLRWADINGNGRGADMVWTDKFTGDSFVWWNRGRSNPAETLGSSFRWERMVDRVFENTVAGTCMHYPDLDGDGRADKHNIKGTYTNEAETWFNRCGLPDVTGDDGPITNPNFPIPEVPNE